MYINIEVAHQDANGAIHNDFYHLTLPQFAKHLAFAGLGIHRSPYQYFRFLGFLFEFSSYWPWGRNQNAFGLPYIIYHDPTERGQISNKIGRALADFLAKKIYNVKYTHNYETAMRYKQFPIKGSRPDFYCDIPSKNQQCAIEAKGYSAPSVSDNEMQQIKFQSSQGPLPAQFTVASVAYNLYESPKVKFYDPSNEGAEYDEALSQKLAKDYYQSILSMIEMHQLRKEDEKTQPSIPNVFDAYLISPSALNPIFKSCSLYLLVHKSIANNSWSMESDFLLEYNNNDEISFVDTDGVGICLRLNT